MDWKLPQAKVLLGLHQQWILETKELTCSVPQGSAYGANLFTCYASTLDGSFNGWHQAGIKWICQWSLCFKAKSREDKYSMIATIEELMLKIKEWMDTVRLKIKESKTEFMWLESRQQLKKCTTTTNSLEVLGENIEKSEVIRYLRGYLDSTLTFKQHIKTKCKSALLNLFKIISIRNSLDKETVTSFTLPLCLSYLDYANGLLIGLPDCSIKLMQKVQNMAAKVVLNLKKHDSSTDAIKTLHWLPIRQQIAYKIINLTQ